MPGGDFCYAKLHAATDCPTKDPTGSRASCNGNRAEGNYYPTLRLRHPLPEPFFFLEPRLLGPFWLKHSATNCVYGYEQGGNRSRHQQTAPSIRPGREHSTVRVFLCSQKRALSGRMLHRDLTSPAQGIVYCYPLLPMIKMLLSSTPYAYMHLHGPHTHGAGTYPTEAECVKNGKEIVKSNAHIKGFKPNSAAYRCYGVENE